MNDWTELCILTFMTNSFGKKPILIVGCGKYYKGLINFLEAKHDRKFRIRLGFIRDDILEYAFIVLETGLMYTVPEDQLDEYITRR